MEQVVIKEERLDKSEVVLRKAQEDADSNKTYAGDVSQWQNFEKL